MTENSEVHLSVVSPVYLAEDCVDELCRRLKASISRITERFEIILVDDRSPDGSWPLITKQSQSDFRVRGIRLANNFGQHKAITAGLDAARGDWIVVMDCDLQDPPEAIPDLYKTAIGGFDMVTAEFSSRQESWTRQRLSGLFWALLSFITGAPFDRRVGNFRIMSRKVVTNFRLYREQYRLLGGIIKLMGFETTQIPIPRQARHAGHTSYTLRKLISVSLEIATAYSDRPLKVIVFAGLIISAAALVLGTTVGVLSLLGKTTVTGWASMMVSSLFLSGLIIATLGVIAFYLAQTLNETKRRPLYVVDEITDGIPQETDLPRQTNKTASFPSVIWITGLSGSGKSTLARGLAEHIESSGIVPIVLDGDELRTILSDLNFEHTEYGREERLSLAKTYSRLAGSLAEQGHVVIVATISMFREIYEWNRANLPDYFEIYLDTELDELRRRDPKGIYRDFDLGRVQNVSGLDMAVEYPESPDWKVDSAEFGSPEKVLEVAIHKLRFR